MMGDIFVYLSAITLCALLLMFLILASIGLGHVLSTDYNLFIKGITLFGYCFLVCSIGLIRIK